MAKLISLLLAVSLLQACSGAERSYPGEMSQFTEAMTGFANVVASIGDFGDGGGSESPPIASKVP